jgi:hypothetical protein
MNVNQAATDAFLRRASLNNGVDSFLSVARPSWMRYLDSGSSSSSSSSDASSTTSGASDYSSSSDGDSSSCPSLRRRDDYSSSSESSDTMDRFMDNLATTNNIAAAFSSVVPSFIDIPAGAMDVDDEFDEDENAEGGRKRKDRASNRFGYTLGDYMNCCNYVRKFLSPEVRDVTYQKSRDRRSTFRSSF